MTLNTIDLIKLSSQDLESRKYQDLIPEYYELEKVVENSVWHNHQNVLDHVIGVFKGLETVLKFEDQTLDQKNFLEQYLSQTLGKRTRGEILIVGALLHDIAKNDTLVKHSDGTAGCPAHELIGAGRVRRFSQRFNLNSQDEIYAERIVRFHGFISEILNLILSNGEKTKYLQIFTETVGDVAIELNLLMHADLLGSNLNTGDPQAYQERIKLLNWMLEQLYA
jgi:UTP:GlnB (protein PII) uridylyltransferase